MERIKLIFFVFCFTISINSFSQSTDFTEEENQYVEKIIYDLENAKTNMQIINKTYKALEEVPYHPRLVLMYIIALKNQKTQEHIEKALSYCQRLDDDYLSNNSSILEFCSHISFLVEDNYDFLKKNSSLHQDQVTQEIINSIIAYVDEDTEEFVSLARPAVEKGYTGIYPLRQIVLSALVKYYYSTNNTKELEKLYKNHFEYSQEEVADLRTFVIFSEYLNYPRGYTGLLGLIKNTEKMYPELENWLGIFKAKPYAGLNNNYLAEEALLNSLKLNEDEINKLLTGFEINYFEYFYKAILLINNLDVQINLAEALLEKENYEEHARLLLASFYSESDIEMSLKYLSDFAKTKNLIVTSNQDSDFGAYSDEVNLLLLQTIFKLNFEFAKSKDNNFLLIDQNLSELYEITGADFLNLLKYKNQLKANLIKESEIFKFEEVKKSLENIDNQNFSDQTEKELLNEQLELLTIVASYFTNKNEAKTLLENCVYCKNYNVEFLYDAIDNNNNALIIFLIDKTEVLDDQFNLFQSFFLAKTLNLTNNLTQYKEQGF